MSEEIVAFDLEGTLTAGVAWEGMRDYLLAHDQAGKFRRFYLPRLPQALLYRWGMIRDVRAFKEKWLLDQLKMFSGYSTARMREVAAWVVERQFWPGRRLEVVDELEAHLEAGRRVVLVSGMFDLFLELFAQKLRVESVGTPLRFANGRFTGAITPPLNVNAAKVQRLHTQLGVERLHTAYGDTRADIPMLELADNPVAVYPDPTLRAHAQAHHWRIIGL